MADTLRVAQLYLNLTMQPALCQDGRWRTVSDAGEPREPRGHGHLIAETVTKPDDADDASFEGQGT